MFSLSGGASNVANAFPDAQREDEMDTSDSDAARCRADLSNLKVTVGIDEDLQMILEMDPSIVDLVRNYWHL